MFFVIVWMKECSTEQKIKEEDRELKGKQNLEAHPRKGKEREEGRLGKVGNSLTE